MAKMVIFYDDIFSNYSSLAATTEATGYEKEFLDDPDPKKKWRSTGIGATYVTVDMGAATEIYGACMINHNLVAADTTVDFEADAANFGGGADESDAFTLCTFDVKGVTKRNAFCANNWNYRYYRWSLQKASGSYIEFANPFMFAQKYTFTKDENVEAVKGRQRVFVQNVTGSGTVFRTRKYSQMIYSIEFTGITQTQADTLEEIAEYDYCCILPEGESGGEIYFGVIEFGIPRRIDAVSSLYNLSGKFTESSF